VQRKKTVEVPGDWEQDMEPRPSRPKPRFWEDNYGRHNFWFQLYLKCIYHTGTAGCDE
jgi:hypothetical protein